MDKLRCICAIFRGEAKAMIMIEVFLFCAQHRLTVRHRRYIGAEFSPQSAHIKSKETKRLPERRQERGNYITELSWNLSSNRIRWYTYWPQTNDLHFLLCIRRLRQQKSKIVIKWKRYTFYTHAYQRTHLYIRRAHSQKIAPVRGH